jgi:hypothetical protein
MSEICVAPVYRKGPEGVRKEVGDGGQAAAGRCQLCGPNTRKESGGPNRSKTQEASFGLGRRVGSIVRRPVAII